MNRLEQVRSDIIKERELFKYAEGDEAEEVLDRIEDLARKEERLVDEDDDDE